MDLSSKRRKVEADTLAKTLYNEFVINFSLDESGLRGLNIDESHKPAFQTKMLAYKFAIVLMALASEEKNNIRYLNVREGFEKIILEKSQEIQKRFEKVTLGTLKQKITINFHVDIKQAMISLNSLLFSEDRKEFTWAKKWFEEINIEEFNPVNLTLLASKFMNYYIVVVKSLREFDPT